MKGNPWWFVHPGTYQRALEVECPVQAEDYSPEQIRFWLDGVGCGHRACHWAMLESAVEGGTASAGQGAGRGDRFGLAAVKADLERAADQLPVHWQATAYVFRRQHRGEVLEDRRIAAPVREREPEPLGSRDLVLWRMAVSLGWKGE